MQLLGASCVIMLLVPAKPPHHMQCGGSWLRVLLGLCKVIGLCSELEERASCGGAGGNAAANAIQQECEKQSVLCSVVGIPKSVRRSKCQYIIRVLKREFF